MHSSTVHIEESWKKLLAAEFEKEYFQNLVAYLKKEKKSGKKIYPPGSLIFNAFKHTPVQEVKVVILGQDPYHGPRQAMGLSFSVPRQVRVPASLRNIFKELHSDLGITPPKHGDLSKWAEEGVFLLNAMLTVEHKRPGSHKNIGWQEFTNAVIREISTARSHLVFMLWGNFAKSKRKYIADNDHLILESPHPSPLARGGFFDNHHFSRCNEFLLAEGKSVIDWNL